MGETAQRATTSVALRARRTVSRPAACPRPVGRELSRRRRSCPRQASLLPPPDARTTAARATSASAQPPQARKVQPAVGPQVSPGNCVRVRAAGEVHVGARDRLVDIDLELLVARHKTRKVLGHVDAQIDICNTAFAQGPRDARRDDQRTQFRAPSLSAAPRAATRARSARSAALSCSKRRRSNPPRTFACPVRISWLWTNTACTASCRSTPSWRQHGNGPRNSRHSSRWKEIAAGSPPGVSPPHPCAGREPHRACLRRQQTCRGGSA